MKLQDYLSTEQKVQKQELWSKIKTSFLDQGLDFEYYACIYAVAVWMLDSKTSDKPFLFSVSGGQGSGKSTFSLLLAKVLIDLFDSATIVLSLDDFYLKKSEREKLAFDIHPLLKTRGVPGTHDIELMMVALNKARSRRPFEMPIFDKSLDDRYATQVMNTDNLEFIIVEGWCWGAEAVSSSALHPALNVLEEVEDKQGIWREYVNQQMKAYQALFRTDAALFLAVPDMASVIEWRLQQEQGLPQDAKKMSRDEISKFIMFYERITQEMLVSMPERVDICLSLAKNHTIESATLLH